MAEQGQIVVGFDLDMTLVDSRPGIVATLEMLARETSTPIDVQRIVSRLGPPLETELAEWYPPERVLPAADRFRELYSVHGVPGTALLPGAAEAVAAVRAASGKVIVVTAKYEPNAKACLAHAGLGVASGPHAAPELQAAGADAVLESLVEFPTWFTAWLSASGPSTLRPARAAGWSRWARP